MNRRLRYAPFVIAVAGFTSIGLWFYLSVPLPSWMWGPALWGTLTQSMSVGIPAGEAADLHRAVVVRLMMQVLVSLVCLGSSLYVVLAKKYQPKDKHWAFAAIGTVIGFWLKS